MSKSSLSKSTFIKGVQCLKALYLYKNRYFLRDRLSEEQRAKFGRGHAVGVLARDLFPGGINVASSPSQSRKAIDDTRKAMNNGTDVIYEAAFSYKGTLIYLDILVRDGEAWKAYEVKSSRGISETYIQDAALQYNILIGSGLKIHGIYLIHINPDYRLKGLTDLHGLFTIKEVTEEVIRLQPWVEESREKALEAIGLGKSPGIDIGLHCNNPYPCEFTGHCRKHIPPVSVFRLSLFPPEKQYHWYYQGILHPIGIPAEDISTAEQQRQINSLLHNRMESDPELTGNMRPLISRGVYFNTFFVRAAVPFIQNTTPYQAIPLHCTYLLNKEPFSVTLNKERPLQHLFEIIAELAANHPIVVYDDSGIRQCINQIEPPSKASEEIKQKIIPISSIVEHGYWCHPEITPPLPLEEISAILFKKSFAHNSERLASDYLKRISEDEDAEDELKRIVEHNILYTNTLTNLCQLIFSV